MEYVEIIVTMTLILTGYLTIRMTVKPRLSKNDKIVCDTSALIDGRIVSIARSGFLSSELVIPRSVVRELQYMADKADHAKRERARYGLDVINELQALSGVKASIYDDGEVHHLGVDEQLIILAKKLTARLCTTDYNLNKVAKTEDIIVVNVNELAHALRPMHLPGEIISVGIVTQGQNKDQGVGYLDDGSMVVVDKARHFIGDTITVETVRVLQTEAGRMVFAKFKTPPSDQRQLKPSPKRHKAYRRKINLSPEAELVDLANS